MEKVLTKEETLKALRGLGSYKAPRPDGFKAIFFKKAWHLAGKAVLHFVEGVMGGEPRRSSGGYSSANPKRRASCYDAWLSTLKLMQCTSEANLNDPCQPFEGLSEESHFSMPNKFRPR